MTENEMRKKVVDTAREYLYYNETDGSHKSIVDIYNGHKPLARNYKVQYTDPWCATYVSAVSIILNYTDIMPVECGCDQMIELYKKIGAWQEEDAYIPKPGDVIFYDWDDNGIGDCGGYPEHVGIVVQVTTSVIKVIEGNKSNSVDYREILINGQYIRGYGIPAYGSKTTENVHHNIDESIYIVQKGDTLFEIARRSNVPLSDLIKYNEILNPDYIQVGQNLKIPVDRHSDIYTVKKGDTLSKIAKKYGVSLDYLLGINDIKNKDLILEGDKIKIK